MTYRSAMLALVCVGASGLAIGQAQTPPSQDTTTPPSSTTTPRAPNEAPTPNTSASRPADASSPHQRQATGKEHEKMMKDCVKEQRAQNSSMSKDAAKKACEEQMKSSTPSKY
jgi:hypothetical protein